MPFLSTNMYNGWKQWLVEAFTRYNIVDCRKLAISYWALWFTRNKLYHEGIRDSVHDMVSFINAYFLETEQMSVVSFTLQRSRAEGWNSPEGEIIKINFDASFDSQSLGSVLGVIARNKDGLVLRSCAYPWRNIPDPTIVEAKACLVVVTFTMDLGVKEICMESFLENVSLILYLDRRTKQRKVWRWRDDDSTNRSTGWRRFQRRQNDLWKETETRLVEIPDIGLNSDQKDCVDPMSSKYPKEDYSVVTIKREMDKSRFPIKFN